ncbi:MAG: helix-turn-helix domain-containing protein [Deltaproteobacteria bacterium]|nr:helix-turn-helix domain-containing protein [Deltaproteobacteria bacterium]
MAVINVQLPAKDAGRTAEAIRHLLTFGGQDVLWLNDEGEPLLSVEEVFPDMSPAKVLRGFRGRDDMKQSALAEMLGIAQTRVSEMESGKRPISVKMAKQLAKIFDTSYKAFL